MAEIDALKLHQNVLIMQGIVASDALTILADLLHRVRMKSGKSTLQLWDIFSLICASGAAGPLAILIGPGQQTLEQCREFLQTVEENIASLSGHGSNLDSMANHSQSREDLEERLEKARTSMGQCDAVVWSHHYADELPEEIKTSERKQTLEQYFWRACRVREYPPLGFQDPRNPKFPWHGLLTDARTNGTLSDTATFVTIRRCTDNALELANEREDLKLEGIKHYPFLVDGPQPVDSSTYKAMMEAATNGLAKRFDAGHKYAEGSVVAAASIRAERL